MKKSIVAIFGIGILVYPLICFCSYIIHLKDGREFTIDRYYEEGDQIKFKRYGGVIGIEKGLVREIEEIEDVEEVPAEKAEAKQEVPAAKAEAGKESDGVTWQKHMERGIALRSDVSIDTNSRFAQAETEYRTALSKLEKMAGKKPVKTGKVRKLFIELESLLRTRSKNDELILVIKKRLAILTKIIGKENMLIATTHFNLASALEKNGKIKAALAEYKMAKKTYESISRHASAKSMEKRIARLVDGQRETTSTPKPEMGRYGPIADSESKEAMLPHGMEYNRLSIPPDVVKKAITFGEIADYRIAEFGSVDFGLNNFDLKKEKCSIRLVTPFLRMAGMSKYYSDKKQTFVQEEIDKTLLHPLEIKLILDVAKADVKEQFTMILKGNGLIVDLSGNLMEASYCDDKTGRCVRAISYPVFEEKIKKLKRLDIVIESKSMGKEILNVDMKKIW